MSRVIPARARYDLLRNGSFAAHEKGTKCIYPRVFCRGMWKEAFRRAGWGPREGYASLVSEWTDETGLVPVIRCLLPIRESTGHAKSWRSRRRMKVPASLLSSGAAIGSFRAGKRYSYFSRIKFVPLNLAWLTNCKAAGCSSCISAVHLGAMHADCIGGDFSFYDVNACDPLSWVELLPPFSAQSFFCFFLDFVSFAQIKKMQHIWALYLSLLASIALAQPATSTSPTPAQSTACGTIVNDPSMRPAER